MIEYAPWSKAVVNRAANLAAEGRLMALDIELSGKCSFNCLYCETPFRDRESRVDFDKVCAFLNSKKIEWVYICGIGEPTYDSNEEHLLRILECCKRNDIKCSIFTNLSNLSEKLIEYIKQKILYVTFKFDSRLEDVLNAVYNPKDAKPHIGNINKICELVGCENNVTNVAASIVPTKYNVKEVPKLVEWCIERNIYPFVGQLERSGSAVSAYDKLYLADEKLKKLKKHIETSLGEEYTVPFCPAVIFSIHISNEGKITIDKRTGLSCHWFWLDEPVVEEVCGLDEINSLEEAADRVLKTRKKLFDAFVKNHAKYKNDILGGCGGNKKEIFELYVKIMRRQ